MLNPPTPIIESWIREHFQKCSKRGKEINAECALCKEGKSSGKKRRFFYNVFKHKWFCHNCNARGADFYSLVAAHDNITYGNAVSKFRQHLLQNIEDVWKKKPEKKITLLDGGVEFDLPGFLEKRCFRLSPKFPEGMLKKSLAKRAVAEIEAHGVSQNDYPFYVCFQGDYRNRLIIPFYNKGGEVYFQGRAIVKNLMPKYKNCPTSKQSFIFQEENFHPDLPIYVFEGFWEAFILDRFCGMNSTAVLGKYIPREFVERVLQKTSREVVICLDNDEAGKKALNDFEPISPRVKCLIYPVGCLYKDIGEMWARFRDVHSIKDFLKSNTYEFWARKVLFSYK